MLPPIFSGDPFGVWVGRGPERGQGPGMPKKTPRSRPLSGAGRGKGLEARVFWGPVRPVTHSRGDLGRRFCWVVSVPVFLYEFQEVVEVLDRFSGVVCSLIAFPVNQEFVLGVLAAGVEYLLSFPFFWIVD